MQHEIEDGLITVVKVVNPCFYWVRCSKCVQPKEMSTGLRSSTLLQPDSFQRGNKVVLEFYDNTLYRGVVQGTDATQGDQSFTNLYEIFLIDFMATIIVSKDKIFIIDELNPDSSSSPPIHWIHLPQQLHIIGLEGGIPIENTGTLIDLNGFTPSDEYPLKHIRELLKTAEWLEFRKKVVFENITYGKIRIGKENHRQNLLRILLEKGFAHYSPDFINILLMNGWMGNVLNEIDSPKKKMNPLPLEEPDDHKELLLREKLPPPPVYKVDTKLIEDMNIGNDVEDLVDTILPVLQFETYDQFNDRMRVVSSILRKPRTVAKEEQLGCIVDNNCSANDNLVDSKTKSLSAHNALLSDDGYDVSSSDAVSTSSCEVSTHDSDSGHFNLAACKISNSNDPNERCNFNINEEQETKSAVSTYIGKHSPLQPLFYEKPYLSHSEANTSSMKTLKVSPVSNSTVPTSETRVSSFLLNGSRMLGRGRLLLERVECSRTPEPPSKFCEKQPDVSNSQGQTSCVLTYARKDPYSFSDSDSLDGFLESTSDSDCYRDVLRINTPPDDYLFSTPLPSLLEVAAQDEVKYQPFERQWDINDFKNHDMDQEIPVPPVPVGSQSFLLGNEKSGLSSSINQRPAIGTITHGLASLESLNTSSKTKSSLLSPNSCIGRGRLVHLLSNSSPAPNDNSVNSALNGQQSDNLSSIGAGRGKILKKLAATRNSFLNVRSEAPSQFCDSNDVGRSKPPTHFPGRVATPKQVATRSESVSINPLSNVPAPRFPLKFPFIPACVEKANFLRINNDVVRSQESGTKLENLTQKSHLSNALSVSKGNSMNDVSTIGGSSSNNELNGFGDKDADELFSKDHPLSEQSLAKLSAASNSAAGILHGSNEVFIADHIASLGLNELVYKKVRRFGYLTRPQQFGIPAILKRRNVVMICRNNTMKSTACVLPVIHLLMEADYYSALRKGNGPRCVIVAPTSSRVKHLGMLCSQFTNSRLLTLTTYGGGLELERKNELSAGCDILITTPKCWLRLLEYPTVTNMSRLCHLILDRFDILSELFPLELQSISDLLKDLIKIRSSKNEEIKALDVQIIVNAEQWSPSIDKMTANVLSQPILIFNNYLEATFYAQIKPVVVILKPEVKMDKLRELLKKYSSKKTVIVCRSSAEVIEIRKMDSSRSIIAHEEMAKSLLSGVNELWKRSKSPVLICTDIVIFELNVNNADVLIHFSLPLSKAAFSERFVVFRDSIPDRILNPQAPAPSCSLHILIDETFEEPFPFIVEILKRMMFKIPRKIFEAAKAISRKKEESKINAPFCENLLQLGECYRVTSCMDRHVIFPNVDRTKDGPTNKGYLKMQIVTVHSAVKFSVRILGYSSDPSNGGHWTPLKSDYMFLSFKMASHFASNANKRLHGKVEVGDVLAYQEAIDQPFQRARVQDIVARNELQEPTLVELFLVDTGSRIDKAMSHTLFELPEELKKYPNQVVFIYLGKLKPVDSDTSWSYAAKRIVERAIHKREVEEDGSVDIVGKVLFSLGENFVVENVHWCRRLKTSVCFDLDLRQLILKSGCGIDNPTYTLNLTKIYRECDFEEGICYSVSAKVNKGFPGEVGQQWDILRWAYISPELEYSKVSVTMAESPTLFYVKLDSFSDRLLQLQSNLEREMSTSKSHLKAVIVGDICVAESPDDPGSWNRGLILQIKDNSAEIFYVDYGDRKWLPLRQLYAIPLKFLIQLPFQAIECKLAGVRANEESIGWSNAAINAFHELTAPSTSIYAKVVDFDLKGNRTGGKHYHVVLLDVDGDTPVLLNKKFVIDLGFGVWVPSEEISENRLAESFEVFRTTANENITDDVISTNEVLCSDSDEENWDATLSEQSNANVMSDQMEDYVLNQSNGSTTIPEESGCAVMQWDQVDAEDAQEFFFSLYFGPQTSQKPLALKGSDLKEATASIDLNGVEDKSVALDFKKHDQNGMTTSQAIRVEQEQQVHPKFSEDEPPHLVLLHQFKTPSVHWRQDEHSITVAYMIPCIKYYQIHLSSNCISFGAIMETENGKDEYWLQIQLYGYVWNTIVSEVLSVTSFRITLKKMVQGYLWPRLTFLETKDSRIKLDPQVADRHVDEGHGTIREQLLERGLKMCQRKRRIKRNYKSENCAAEDSSSSDEELLDVHHYEVLRDDLRDDFDPFG